MSDSAPRKALVVTVPGLVRNLAGWERLKQPLLDKGAFAEFASIDWRVFDHKLSFMSRTRLDTKANELRAWIGQLWVSGDYTDVVLVGHSMGAAIVRQAWLDAASDAHDDVAREWTDKVRRFVLFAGLSRGVCVTSNPGVWAAVRFAELVPGRFTGEDCVRGSRFLANLRIAWMQKMADLDADKRPVVVQVIGTRDDLVKKEDSLDVSAFGNARRVYIPEANHGDLYQFKEAGDDRLTLFVRAFTGQVPPDADDRQDRSSPEVLMVLHGIRASRRDEWIDRAKARAEILWPGAIVAAPSYGYLSALRFALPNVRRRYSRHFRDFYAELRANHPQARFNVLCHSNGTYLLGRGLAEIPAIRIERVALAGSVLPREYDWGSLAREGRVKQVRSDGGSLDWPVGLLCSGLRGLRMRDLGTGGYAGFNSDVVKDVRFHAGGHGAMLQDANIDSMLGFLRTGEFEDMGLSAEKAPLAMASNLMPYVAITLAIGIPALLGYFAWYAMWPAFFAVIVIVALLALLLDVI
jgi:alpha-beta hydrolase superfamily lysophospholipase